MIRSSAGEVPVMSAEPEEASAADQEVERALKSPPAPPSPDDRERSVPATGVERRTTTSPERANTTE